MTEATRQRSRFRRPRDYLVLAIVVVLVAGTWFVVRQTSDAHNTISQTTKVAATAPNAPAQPPPSLAEVWRHPSAATPEPITSGATVVTGDDGAVVGRDPITGKQRWRYSRDRQLCTVGEQWGRILAFHSKNNWCGEITSLYPDTGERGAQRNGDTPLGTRMVGDGERVTTTGKDVLDTFDSRLIRSVVYGKQPAPKNSGRQPRIGCDYRSVTSADSRIGVVEHCGQLSSQPDGGADRFTVYGTESKGKDNDQPDVRSSVPLPGKDARVIAMNDRYAAVSVPDPARLLVLDTANGAIKAQYALRVPPERLRGEVPGEVVTTSKGPHSVYWYTGAGVVALDSTDFRPQWTLDGALGPGTQFAGRTLIPMPSGIEQLDPRTGRKLGEYRIDRGGYRGPITMSTLGPVVFEQRGRQLVALR